MNDVSVLVIRSAVQVLRRKGEIKYENDRKESGGSVKTTAVCQRCQAIFGLARRDINSRGLQLEVEFYKFDVRFRLYGDIALDVKSRAQQKLCAAFCVRRMEWLYRCRDPPSF